MLKGLSESLGPSKDTKKVDNLDTFELNINAQRILVESEREITGVLTLKIKEVQLDTGFDFTQFRSYACGKNSADRHVYCTMQVRNFTRRTKSKIYVKLVSKCTNGAFKYKQTNHFPVKVPK